MPNKTLGSLLNAGLKEIGEPVITSLTSTNILELNLIEAINNCVGEIKEEEEYAWTLKRTVLSSTAKITTGSVAVTNGSTTVTSVDSNGNDATNFTNVSAGMYIRLTGDNTSYLIDSVNTAGTPHTATIETGYVGTTTTASGYAIFQDTYALTTSNFDEIKIMTYGDGAHWTSSLRGFYGDNCLEQYDSIDELVQLSGGDLHRDTSGKPVAFARYSPDTSDNPQIVLWPYPSDEYVFQLYYTLKYTDASAFDANLFGNDAPDIAYIALDNAVRAAACLWDEDSQKAMYWEGKKRENINKIKSRENRQHHAGNAMKVYTGRQFQHGVEVRSQIAFDTKSARRY